MTFYEYYSAIITGLNATLRRDACLDARRASSKELPKTNSYAFRNLLSDFDEPAAAALSLKALLNNQPEILPNFCQVTQS